MYTFAYMSKPDNNKPYPIRLGDDLKPFLQGLASDERRSLHCLIKNILFDFKRRVERKKKKKKKLTREQNLVA